MSLLITHHASLMTAFVDAGHMRENMKPLRIVKNTPHPMQLPSHRVGKGSPARSGALVSMHHPSRTGSWGMRDTRTFSLTCPSKPYARGNASGNEGRTSKKDDSHGKNSSFCASGSLPSVPPLQNRQKRVFPRNLPRHAARFIGGYNMGGEGNLRRSHWSRRYGVHARRLRTSG